MPDDAGTVIVQPCQLWQPDAADCMVMDLRISPNYDQDGSIVALCNTAYTRPLRRN